MKIKTTGLFLMLIFLFQSSMAQNTQDHVLHKIQISLAVDKGTIQVSDTMLIPEKLWSSESKQSFMLNSGLTVTATGKDCKITKESGEKGAYLTKYTVESHAVIDGSPALVLNYKGNINRGFEEEGAEYSRGFKQTDGVVSDTGVFLAGSTYWLPSLSFDPMMRFVLRCDIDKDWLALSEGKRTSMTVQGNVRHIVYETSTPVDEVYLVANKWTEYDTVFNKVDLQAFLINPDKDLADKYLKATISYMDLYNQLIGPYPYSKFALVENFWETGYGMPSFTLLGQQVIRFPWIIYSSYPHELLHNYWGNGVFVKSGSGNWCEGITAYMADHLFKEERGQGDAYRQAVLEKYTNYVNDGNDFPVREFVNRNNPAQEAVGYGKVLMINNMLRTMLGDEAFIEAYRTFYKHYRFTRAGFKDIKTCFEQVGQRDLDAFFSQWIQRTGAPQLRLSDLSVDNTGTTGKYTLSFKLTQVQKEDVFDINVPVEVFLEGMDEATGESLEMNSREQVFTVQYSERPLRIAVDAHFNLMRKLDKTEISPTLSQIFGQENAILVLPSQSAHLDAYRQLAGLWRKNQEGQHYQLEIVMDSELAQLPQDKGVWIIGYENKFCNTGTFSKLYKDILPEKDLQQVAGLQNTGALVYVVANKDKHLPVAFLGAQADETIGGLSHRLLHYGKYSLLGFAEPDGSNVMKTILPVLHSPLVKDLFPEGEQVEVKAKSPQRKALSAGLR